MIDYNDDFFTLSPLEYQAYYGIPKSAVDEVIERYPIGSCVPAVLEYLADGTPVRTLFAVKEVRRDDTPDFDWTLRVELHAPHLPHNPTGVLYYDERGRLIDEKF